MATGGDFHMATGSRRAESVLEIGPERAPFVREAFELYATGNWSIKALHTEMTKRGLRTRRGTPLSLSKLPEILKHKIYAGIVSWGEIEVPGKHPALVSQAIYERVQEVLRAHDKAGPRTRKHAHHLRGALVCASCGSRLGVTVSKGRSDRYPYFFCFGRGQRRTDCREPYVPVERIEQQVEALYAGIQLSPDARQRLRARLEQEITKRAIGGEREAVRQTKRLARIQAQRQMALQAHYRKAISVELLKSEQDRLDQEEVEVRKRLTVDRSELEKARTAADLGMELIENCRESYLKAASYAKETCERIRRHWTQALFEAIYVGNGEVRRFVYRDPLPQLLAWAGSNSVPSGSPYRIRTGDLSLERAAS